MCLFSPPRPPTAPPTLRARALFWHRLARIHRASARKALARARYLEALLASLEPSGEHPGQRLSERQCVPGLVLVPIPHFVSPTRRPQ